jgi:hypothetical protein
MQWVEIRVLMLMKEGDRSLAPTSTSLPPHNGLGIAAYSFSRGNASPLFLPFHNYPPEMLVSLRPIFPSLV